MSNVLEEIIELGGLALQSEDSILRASYRVRSLRGGLAHVKNERYHQFVLWRALVPLWNATFEADRLTDIVVERDGTQYHIEMKNWRDPENHQIPAIQRDIERLGHRAEGYIVLTSMNRRGQMSENFEWLASKLKELAEEPPKAFCFKTEDKDGSELEFWIAGWRVKPTAPSEEGRPSPKTTSS